LVEAVGTDEGLAATVVKELAGPEKSPMIIATLMRIASQNPGVARDVFRINPPLGKPVGDVITTGLVDSEKMVRFYAARLLSRALKEEPTFVDALIGTARSDGDPEVRAAALQCLYHVPKQQTRSAIVAALNDTDPRVRAAAVNNLSQLASDIPVLPLSNPDYFKPANLGNLKERDDLESKMVEALADVDERVQKAAVSGVLELATIKGTEALLKLANNNDAGARAEAIFRLAPAFQRSETAVVDRIFAALKDPDPGVRERALGVIWDHRYRSQLTSWTAYDDKVLESVADLLGDGNVKVRKKALDIVYPLQRKPLDSGLGARIRSRLQLILADPECGKRASIIFDSMTAQDPKLPPQPSVVIKARNGLVAYTLGAHERGPRGGLTGAYLHGAELAGADLADADLSGTDFEGAKLGHACFQGANLQRANLMKADLGEADFRGANLSGAKLASADLNGAQYDATTVWPAGFDPGRHGARICAS
jgi:hypothetical protein